MMKKSLQNVNYWYSVDCVRHSFFLVFASDGESACKYSLIFRGRSENSDGKIAEH